MCGTQVKIETVEGDFNAIESPEHRVDSIINVIIGDIASESVKINLLDRTFPTTISNKIAHNQLRKKRRIIQQYKSYSSHIEKAYASVDKQVVNGKQSAMVLLNDMYDNALQKFEIDPFSIDINKVRENADDIIENITTQLRKFLYQSSNVPPYKEQVEIGINVVIAHAFVECIVLENPNAAN